MKVSNLLTFVLKISFQILAFLCGSSKKESSALDTLRRRNPSSKPPHYFNLKEAFKDVGNYDSRVSRDMGSSHVTSLPEESVTDTYGNYPTAMFKGYVIQIKISPK